MGTYAHKIAPYAPVHDTAGLGKAMRKILPQQRAFVMAYVETGGIDATAAARAAGYGGTPGAQRVAGYRLTHDEKVLAAIKEEADKVVRSGVLLGAKTLVEIAANPSHKDQLKAATELMNRSGLLLATQHNVNVNVNLTDDREIAADITAMARKLGLDPRALLGQAGLKYLPAPDTIDAEFEVVEEGGEETEEDPTMSAEGLEDLL